MLKKGLNAYAYNIGIESEDTDRTIHYKIGKPALSAFHRLGLTDTLTAGLSLQADPDIQQIGATALKATPLGTVGAEASASRSNAVQTGMAARLSYRYQDIAAGQALSASATYKGKNFTVLGQPVPLNPAVWEIAGNYNQRFLSDSQIGLGGRYRFGRGGDGDDWSYSLNFMKPVFVNCTLSVSLESRKQDGTGILVGMTWVPRHSRQTISTSVDTLTRTRNARWDWQDGQRVQAGLGVTQDGQTLRGDGHVVYTGERAEASLYHDIARLQSPSAVYGTSSNTQLEQRTQIRAGTALAFADGHVALSRPINRAFALLTRNDALARYTIGINPRTSADGTTAFDEKIDWAGAAVIPDATPYMVRSVRIDTHGLPVGYDVERDHFTIRPGYKSGTLIEIGGAANIYADGWIITTNHTPVALAAGRIHNMNDPSFPDQEFFTNRKGRFRISALKPGAYTLTLYDHPQHPLTLTIPAKTPPGRFKAGHIVLKGAGS